MKEYRVKMDCFCRGYLHEKSFYWTKDLVSKKLHCGDVVAHEKTWSNTYGTWYRVWKDGVSYDVDPEVLEPMPEELIRPGAFWDSGLSQMSNRDNDSRFNHVEKKAD